MRVSVFLMIFLVACGTPEETLKFVAPEVYDPIEVEAKVIYRPFVNKAGKTIEGSGDYFLEYGGEEWFIKFSAGSVLRDDVAPLLNQTALFRLTESDGLWDTDDPRQQSRVGKYVILHEIVQR